MSASLKVAVPLSPVFSSDHPVTSPVSATVHLACTVLDLIAPDVTSQVLGPKLREEVKLVPPKESLFKLVPGLGWAVTGLWKDAEREGLNEALKIISQLEELAELTQDDQELLILNLQRAAHSGHADSIVKLGQLLVKKGELDEAKGWFLKVADGDIPHPVAQFELYELLKISNPQESQEWLLKAKNSGLLELDLDQIPELEKSGKIEPLFKARWRAATLGNADSMVVVAKTFLLKTFNGDPLDWFQKAASLDHPEGHFGLYLLLKKQQKEHTPGALMALLKAAKAGHPIAMAKLSHLYEKGEDALKPNSVMASYWKMQIPFIKFKQLEGITYPNSTLSNSLLMPNLEEKGVIITTSFLPSQVLRQKTTKSGLK